MSNLSKILLLLVGTSFVSAASRSGTAFDAFKGLQGKWAIQSAGKTLTILMSYDLGSNGSIVTEQFGKELSVFYRDGDGLVMTHFCNAGNQPRLRLAESGDPALLTFEMFDIANLRSPDAAHVQRIIYRIVSATRVDLEIVWREGKSEESEKYILTKL